MAGIHLKGMTWAHRRAVDPLVATLPGFKARRPDVSIEWTSRPLHGFEFTPVSELARSFDLIVLDHPFAGDIAASGCLLPFLAGVAEECAFVGPSRRTYEYDEKLWALPIDAACQVAVGRPDLLSRLDRPPPARWDDVLALGRQARRHGFSLAIGLKGVHALMTFFSLCANLGRPCATEPGAALADEATAKEALGLMRQLVELCPPQCLDWNSIALHDEMSSRDDLVFCPGVYCYATYAEGDRSRPLRFHDFPGPRGPQGSTIGGTGLGISAHCGNPQAALSYAEYLGEAATQLAFARHHGQPARVEAWNDAGVNESFGNCYRSTRTSIEQSWIRPRYAGYLSFQARGGELIEQHLRGNLAEAALLDELQRAFEASASRTA